MTKLDVKVLKRWYKIVDEKVMNLAPPVDESWNLLIDLLDAIKKLYKHLEKQNKAGVGK